MREVSPLVSRGLWFLTQRDLFLIMHQVRGFLVQFTALVLWESVSYPSKIGIVTEISLTESILNRIKSEIKSIPDLVNRNRIDSGNQWWYPALPIYRSETIECRLYVCVLTRQVCSPLAGAGGDVLRCAAVVLVAPRALCVHGGPWFTTRPACLLWPSIVQAAVCRALLLGDTFLARKRLVIVTRLHGHL